MGLGGMIGSGIFVLIGEGGAVAGSAVWISFLLAGVIALLTGYSYGKLGARYPSAGGLVEFLTQEYGVGLFSGSVSVLYYFSQIIGISMAAVSFGSYATPLLFGSTAPPASVPILASSLLVFMTLVNFLGSKAVTKAEKFTVGVNVTILLVFTVPALTQVDMQLLAPSTYPGADSVLSSLAITFFAFTGFGIITNTAEDLENPQRDVPRAMMLAIAPVVVLYVAVSVAVYGTMDVSKVIAAKDTALAVAAEPILGRAGFVLMSLSALLATASVINANLYGTMNQTYLLAKDGELPKGFGRHIWKNGTEGLAITAVVGFILVNTLDLTAIASLAAITTLVIYSLVNIGHLRLSRETGARRFIVLLASLGCLTALTLFVIRVYEHAPKTLVALGVFVSSAFVVELLLQRVRKRKIRPRVT